MAVPTGVELSQFWFQLLLNLDLAYTFDLPKGQMLKKTPSHEQGRSASEQFAYGASLLLLGATACR